MKKFLIALLCLLVGVGSAVGIGYAIKSGNITTPGTGNVTTDIDKDATLLQIAELNKQVDEYAKQVVSLNSYIDELKAQDENNKAVIDGLEEVINNKTLLIEDLQNEISVLQLQYDKLQSEYDELRVAYDSSQLSSSTILGLYDGSITDLQIPEGVTTIRPYAFYNYTGLEHVHLPSTIMEIGQFAFYGCENLRHFEVSSSNDLTFGYKSLPTGGSDRGILDISTIGNLDFRVDSFETLTFQNVTIRCHNLQMRASFGYANVDINCVQFDRTDSLEYSDFSQCETNITMSGYNFTQVINNNTYGAFRFNSGNSNIYFVDGDANMSSLTGLYDVSGKGSLMIHNETSNYLSVSNLICSNMDADILGYNGAFKFKTHNLLGIYERSCNKFVISAEWSMDQSLPMFPTEDNGLRVVVLESEDYFAWDIRQLVCPSTIESIYVSDSLYDQYVSDKEMSEISFAFKRLSELSV